MMHTPHRPARSSRRVTARVAALSVVALAIFSSSAASARDVNTSARPSTPALAAFHLRLAKSEPSKDAELATAPTAIHLWFSLPPEMAVTTVKLADADGKPVTLSKPHRGSGASDPVDVDITGALHAGSYVVSWKTASKDGHPVTGDFSFTVKAGE